jgi:hypothetical protein
MRVSKQEAMGAAFGLLAAVGCSSGEEGPESSSKEAWRLVFTYNGSDVMLPLQGMDVYLVEDEEEYPEVYEINGPGVTMVGVLPMDSHVGYDENWPILFGKSIVVHPRGGAFEEKESFIQLPDGTRARILGGSLVPEKVSGKYSGSEGDVTLSGTFTLRVMTSAGQEEISGRFAVHCVTWG